MTTVTEEPKLQPMMDEAMSRIPPLWPLTHFVAVNPFMAFSDRPFGDTCALLQKINGVMPLQSAEQYLKALSQGVVRVGDLRDVADDEWPVERLIETLEQREDAAVEPIWTFADFLDHQDPHAHWGVLVVDEISKWCGVAYDQNQTTWNSPWKNMGLFAGWRDAAVHDRNPEANGFKGFRAFVAKLPHTADETIEFCMKLLEQPKVDPVDFMHRQLATISGWAGYLQYLVREDSMRGAKNSALKELLAIRLAYDAALFDAFACSGSQRSEWRRLGDVEVDQESLAALERWQQAYELGYQRELVEQIACQPSKQLTVRPVAQAIFCIDVRSERFRRNLEKALKGVQTIGFAGFFGFPVAHKRAGHDHAESRCPVLLVPPIECSEKVSDYAETRASRKRAGKGAWKAFQNSAASCFSFVESMGLGFIGALTGLGHHPTACDHASLPEMDEMSTEGLVDVAEGALRNMSLTKNFARIVLVCGHGSHSSNNPYASSLDCGACGGHAGDVNARLAAEALNQRDVRKLLAQRGIEIPDDTVFVAGLHDTLSDDVKLYELDSVPETHKDELGLFQDALKRAGAKTRKERAKTMGISADSDDSIESAVRKRGADISEVRPEWGLANNAAIVVGPRSRTSALNLDGRVFLHDYDPEADQELKVLSLILCAPVVVASWINLQYYASRVNPRPYGSGDKALHSVVAGVGVIQGNSGDLKVGLPMQSIHDGEKFVHEPRRLSVIIDTKRDCIDKVLSEQPQVEQLFRHGWIYLVAIEGDVSYRYASTGWQQI